VGSPVLIPKLYDGRNKTPFSLGYQATCIVTPSPSISTVLTASMTSCGFTNLQELISDNSGTSMDALNRTFAHGTVFDPATTRQIQSGQVDPISGIQNTTGNAVYSRDPRYTGSISGVKNFTSLMPQLNIIPRIIPASRLNPKRGARSVQPRLLRLRACSDSLPNRLNLIGSKVAFRRTRFLADALTSQPYGSSLIRS
jgi:hypothetical protein